MATFRRDRTPGATWFFTVVTAERQPWLACAQAIDALRWAMTNARLDRPFEIDAAVVLPDHLHMVWTLPEGDADYGARWSIIKRLAGDRLAQGSVTRGAWKSLQRKRRERGLWQRRFWEHRIRDEEDLQRHVDYIHYNPVRHGLVARAVDWPYSSIHRYIRAGWLDSDWGCDLVASPSFRE